MANITGDANNVYINDANLKILDTTKQLEAPKVVLSNISGTSLTTTGKVGVANTAPIHTLDIGSKVFIDEDDSVTLRVRGAMEVDGFNLASVSNDQVVFNNSGVLVGSSGLTFVQATNTLTTAGPLVAQNTASIADTLTLSKASGDGLVVTADASVGGDLDVTGSLTSGAATLASATVTGTLSSGVATLASATVTGTLSSGAATLASASVTNNATVGGNLGVTGDLSVSGDLNVTGSVTAVNTTNLEVKDPIVAFGDNVTSAGDTGIIFNRHSSENVGNVAMFYDVTATKFKMGYTDGHAGQTALDTNGGELPVEIEGSLSLNKDLTVNTDTLKVDTTNARVGINKAAPAKALDVVGDIESTVSVTTTNVYVTRIFFNAA